MEKNDNNKLKPEEESSGFRPEDYEGNLFGGQKSGTNPKNPDGTKRIIIDTNASSGTYSPPKKSNFMKWFLSFLFIFLLLTAGTVLFLKNFVISPKFLNGTEKETKENQISVEVQSDNETESVNESSPDFGFNTDSIVNSVLARAKNSPVFNEEITKKQNGKTFYWNINKQNNIITIESETYSKDGKKQRFVRRIMVNDKEDIKSGAEAPVSSDISKPENKIVEKIIIREPKTKSDSKTNTIVNTEVPKEIEQKKISIEDKKEIVNEKTGEYTFEKKFGKKSQTNQNIAKTEDKTQSDLTTQEKQFANEGPLYTIQVYSTPNIEDARFWISRLQQLNIKNAYISKQKIRDITWYRVRFGEFGSKEEAKETATKYGFGQLWIDRVK